MSSKEITMKKQKNLSFRLSEEELDIIKQKAKNYGFRTYSELARFVLLNLKDIKIEL